MRIAFFAPHKPIDHEVPSGDLMIGKSLHDFLQDQGHEMLIASRMRLRHITATPFRWLSLYPEYCNILKINKKFKPDLWLTYHSYYKSPDIFGPLISQELGIPYIIYQGVFATKHRRNHRTWLGYMANKKALLYADHVFANKEIDFCNLSRLIISEKLSRTRPGIVTDDFKFCTQSRRKLRQELGLAGKKVVISAAMLREDVKASSIEDLIMAFEITIKREPNARLVIIGDGEARPRLEKLAAESSGDKIIFLGKKSREHLYRYYSAADLFAYPGINESLGMVYLESQSAGLPVVAYSTRGPSEAVIHEKTGLLSPQGDIPALAENILELINNDNLRKSMAEAAPQHIKELFNQKKNLLEVESQILQTVGGRLI